jgi:hypothetical protein
MTHSKADVGVDLSQVLVESYAVNERMNQIVLEHLDPAAWRAKLAGSKGRTIAAIVAHVHNIRRKWLRLANWLPQLTLSNKGRFSQIRKLLSELLPVDMQFTGKMVERDYAFHFHGSDIPFSALSDGYRAYIGWISDLLYHVVATCPRGMKLTDNCGLVLVDEIDLYLHPIWQRTVIETVSKALPNLQFVFTTHSPPRSCFTASREYLCDRIWRKQWSDGSTIQ